MNFFLKNVCVLLIILFLLFSNCCFASFNNDTYYPKDKFENEIVHYTMLSYNVSDDITLYMNELTGKFKEIWKSMCPKNMKYAVMVTFTINADGSFSNLNLFYSSGNLSDDNLVLGLINNFKGYKSLPQRFDSINVQYIFFPVTKDLDYAKALEEINFKPYMTALQRTLRAGWNPPINGDSKRTDIIFNIYKDGRIDKIALYNSSGDKEYDEIALNQIKRLKYFRPLPEKYHKDRIGIIFTYTLNKGVSSSNAVQPIIQNNFQNNTNISLKSTYLLKDLYILPRSSIYNYEGYSFIDALKINQFTSNAYIYHYKIDCANKKIGLKKTYAGSSTVSPSQLGLRPFVRPYKEDVEMFRFDKNNEYNEVYNYVCTE